MQVLAVGICFVWLAYGKAKRKGQNPIRWAAIAASAFLITQVLVSGGIGFALGVWGSSENSVYKYNLEFTIISLLACIITNWIVMRPLNRTEKPFTEPPPPPVFNEKSDLS
ncbi:MAG TPA: hypothetical protein VF648_13745 [Pyrinomonadaceae bacterium]|jgi:heme A synthase